MPVARRAIDVFGLQQADLVKFARFAPRPDDATVALAYGRDIVERTKPRVEEPAPTAPREVA